MQTNGSQYVGGLRSRRRRQPGAHRAARQPSGCSRASSPCVCWSTWRRSRSSRDLTARGASSVRVFAKKDRFPARTDPRGRACSPRSAVEVLPAPEGLAARRHAPIASCSTRRTTPQGAHHLRRSAGAAGRPRRAVASAARERRARAPGVGQPTLVTDRRRGGLRQDAPGERASRSSSSARMPAVEVIRLTAQECLVGARSRRRLPDLLRRAAGACRPRLPEDGGRALLQRAPGRRRASRVWAAAALALGLDRRRASRRAQARRPRPARCVWPPRARPVKRCAQRARASRSPWCSTTRSWPTTPCSTRSSTRRLKEAAARVWVCVLVRPSFERARPTWGSRAAVPQRARSRPLEPAHAAELARRLLLPVEHVPPTRAGAPGRAHAGRPAPAGRAGARPQARRPGAPLGARHRLLPGHRRARQAARACPSCSGTRRREVEALPPQLAGHARLASVLGAGFTVAELEELLQILERARRARRGLQLDASVGTQRLIDAGVLVRHRSGQLDFRHSLLRDTIYQSLPDAADSKRLHRAAFEHVPAPARCRRAASAAPRAARGRRAASASAAANAYLELAERAHEAHAYLEAEAAFGRALENLPETTSACAGSAAARSRADALSSRALTRTPSRICAARALRAETLDDDSELEVELLLDEATVLDWTRDFEQSAVAGARSVERARGEQRLAAGRGSTHDGPGARPPSARARPRRVSSSAPRPSRARQRARRRRLRDARDRADDGRSRLCQPRPPRRGGALLRDGDRGGRAAHADLLHLGAAHHQPRAALVGAQGRRRGCSPI